MPSSSTLSCGCDRNQARQSRSEPQTHSDIRVNASHVSEFHVPQMDCPSEESLIRTAFTSLGEALIFEFDIPNRRVRVYHPDIAKTVEETLTSVGLGANLISVESVGGEAAQIAHEAAKAEELREAQVLQWVLGINAIMFVFELGLGIIAQSTGLIADSLDMFADAAVYGVSLYAVGKAAKLKLKAAHFSGWLQFVLALSVLLEVVRSVLYGSEPASTLMIGAGAVALMANITCLLLIFKSRDQGSNMKASWIFSANDVLANVGVIAAGILVAVTGSQVPDLVIGLLIAGLITSGAVRILRLK